MRLPWPFGRAQRSPSEGGDTDSSGGAAAPVERGPGDAWRRLPRLAETVGPPPLVAPNRPFAAGLASNEPPAPILAPLSHGRSLDAPRGIVSGIARPAATVAAPALPEPVQRSPLGGRRGPAAEVAWPGNADDAAAEPDSTPPERSQPAAAPPAAPAVSSPMASAAPTAPVTVAMPPRRSLTQAPEPARATMPVGLVGQPRAAGSGRSAPAAATPPIQRSPASPSGAPTPPPPAASPSAIPVGSGVAGAPRLSIGQVRRLGLGAPVVGGPVSATTPHVTGSGAASAPFKATPPATRAVPGDPPAPAAVEPAGVQRAPAAGGPMPLAAGVPAGLPGPDDDAPGSAGLEIGAGLTASPSSAPVIARPLSGAAQRAPMLQGAPMVSAQPLRSRVQRAPLTLPQRAPDEEQGTQPGSASATASGLGGAGVRIHRDGAASQLSAALDARSFTHGGEIFLPASHGPLTSGTGKALLAHELTHVAQQRRLGTSLPAEHTPHGRSLESEAVAAERAPDMTLAMPRPAEAPAGDAGPPGVEAGSAASGRPGPQRAPTGGAQPAIEMGPVELLSGGEPPRRRTSKKEQPTEQELEVLAHQLYHRIGRHLRRELLVDRERIGFALDLP